MSHVRDIGEFEPCIGLEGGREKERDSKIIALTNEFVRFVSNLITKVCCLFENNASQEDLGRNIDFNSTEQTKW